jgi:FdhE protein
LKPETYKQIQKILEEEKKRGESPRFFDFFGRIFRIQSEAGDKIGDISPLPGKEEITSRIESGKSALSYDDLVIDSSLFSKTFTGIADTFAEYADLLGELPENLIPPGPGETPSPKTLRLWYEGKEIPEPAKAGYKLLETVIQLTMNPILAAHSRAVAGSIQQERWRRNRCPVCGGKPDLAYLEKENSARYLVCSRCDTEWLFQRIQCPYCDNEEQAELGYLTDEKEVYRLYTCEKCRRYIKAVDLKNAGPEVIMPLLRILTIDMDSQAQEKGYLPGHIEAPL